MDGAHISILKSDMDKIHRTGDFELLGELVVGQLYRLACRNRVRFEILLSQLDHTIKLLKDELHKYNDDPDRRYPPPNQGRVCVAIDVPKDPKLRSVVAWEQVVSV